MLSVLVLVTWNLIFPPVESEQSGASGATGAVSAPGAVGSGGTALEPLEEAPPPLLAAEEEQETAALDWGSEAGGHWRARFSNRGAQLVSLELLDYHPPGQEGVPSPLVRPVTLPDGARTGSLLLSTQVSSQDVFPEPLDEALWVLRGDPALSGEVVYEYRASTGVLVRKTIRPAPDSWDLDVVLEIDNPADSGLPGRVAMQFGFIPAGCVPWELNDRFYSEPNALAIGGEDAEDLDIDEVARDLSSRTLRGDLDVDDPLQVVGVHNKYFACMLRPAEGDLAAAQSFSAAAYVRVPNAEMFSATPQEALDDILAELSLTLSLPAPGHSQAWSYKLYCGPKDPDVLTAASAFHGRLFESDLGIFSGIGRVLLWIMRLFHGWTGNWGVAIILMTLCVRLAIFPLTRKSQVSMARFQTKMKRVQPKIDEIKKRYEDDPKRLREEQARIMQEEQAFPPLGGCLPIFIQMPIFFGLFQMLRTSFDLRQAEFALWIKDLSQPDRLLELGLELPLLGDYLRYLNVLPPLMVVLWILQQRGMPQPTDEQARRMQRMMMWMPVFMGVFLYNYAAGLSLYMITQSGLGIFEQRVIKKLWPIDDREVESKPGCGCGPLSGVMENLAEKQKEQMQRMQELQRQAQQQGGAKKRKKR